MQRWRNGCRQTENPNGHQYLTLADTKTKLAMPLLSRNAHSRDWHKYYATVSPKMFHIIALFTHTPMVCIALKTNNFAAWRDWTAEHISLKENEWKNIRVSDKFRFIFHSDKRQICIWGDQRIQKYLTFVEESFKVGRIGVILLNGISVKDAATFSLFDMNLSLLIDIGMKYWDFLSMLGCKNDAFILEMHSF